MNGSRSAPNASFGTAGRIGSTASRRTYAAPCSGRGSRSPTFGQYDIARSACAVIVSDGFTPRFAETAAPSTTEMPGCP